MSATKGRYRPTRYIRVLLAMIFVVSMMSFASTASAEWVTKSIVRVDTPSGELLDGNSEFARVSGNGRYVVFQTESENITPNDNNESWENDIYCYDRETGGLELISVSTTGTLGDGCSSKPSISYDGRYVVFQSSAENLVADDTNGAADIFLRDRVAGTTILVSKHTDPCLCGWEVECANWPQISSDGTKITYRTKGSDIVPNDTNEAFDIFVYDVASKTTVRANLTDDDEQADGWGEGAHWPTLSADGRFVAFRSGVHLTDDPVAACDDDYGTSSPQVYVRDLELGTTKLVSIGTTGTTGEKAARWPAISGNGRYIAFQSGADNLVEGDTNDSADIFVRDMVSGVTKRVSVASDGTESEGGCSSNPAISADGRYVTFQSYATNLVADDTNDEEDVFIHDMQTGETDLVSGAHARSGGGDSSFGKPSISSDGLVVAFHSNAVVAGDEEVTTTRTSSIPHIYIYEAVGEYRPVAVAGSNRFATSVAASKESFPDGADNVVIATGRNWPDALGGAALAGTLEAPVLLVDTDSVPSVISTEIKRLGATKAIILGGEDAVSGSVEDALDGLKLTVERIGGATRYRTAEMIAARTVDMLGDDYDGTCFVATGDNFADALSASPLACAGGWPVYLSGENGVSATTLSAMKAAGVTDVLLLGGEAAVTPDTAVTILGAGMTAVRIDGDTRYETAAKIATYGVDNLDLYWGGVAITTGLDFPDALSGGVLQGRNSSVMLLTKATSLSGDTRACLTTNKEQIGAVVYLGGTNAVSQSVRDDIAAIIK